MQRFLQTWFCLCQYPCSQCSSLVFDMIDWLPLAWHASVGILNCFCMGKEKIHNQIYVRNRIFFQMERKKNQFLKLSVYLWIQSEETQETTHTTPKSSYTCKHTSKKPHTNHHNGKRKFNHFNQTYIESEGTYAKTIL